MYLLNCCLKCVISVCPLLPFFPSVQLVHLALFICSEKSVSLGFLCSSECSSLSSCSCIKIKHTHLASFILFYLLIYCLKKEGFLICAPSPTVQWWIYFFFFPWRRTENRCTYRELAGIVLPISHARNME